ncbi:ENTH domain containing protein [Nitzschia inconspicua]|uniref:ENTH domain containing protein n=1 Tax=Nitzschia inconspicua TaxID=303405 RepID=A0A9K3KWX8_9STRA|nr:ENTH domain containing protein [Nitzschia inconspicua]
MQSFLKDLSIDKIQNLAEDAFNQAKPKTDVEARVYEVLSHKNWGASGSLMNEIARDTFDPERFYVVTRLMWDSMENQRPSAWRVVFKALTLLEYLVKNGAERCVDDARNHAHILRALGQFNYYEGTIDRGLGVREKSKQLLDILGDDERIREERQKARKLREKFGQSNATASGGGGAAAGYGNQDSWNNDRRADSGRDAGGYGDGGIYENDQGYSGRYGGSSQNPRSTSPVGAPTFAAMPDDGAKKKTKKKKKKPITDPEAAAAPEPEPDLLGFDTAPAPAPVAAIPASEEFGAFQATSASSAPAAATDEFADFGSLRSAPAPVNNDPFAAPAAIPPIAQPQQAFDAFGNNNIMAANNTMTGMMGSGGMTNGMPVPMANNNTGAISGVTNAFGNMNMGAAGGMQQPQSTMPSVSDDDFGDFSTAAPSSAAPAATTNSSDPLSKLINLDGLSKNPSTMKAKTNQQSLGNQMMGNPMMGNQMMGNPMMGNPMMGNQSMPAGMQQPAVVSAGGSDAISSMMGPGAPTPQGMQPQQGGGFSMAHQGSGVANPGMAVNPQMQQQQQNQFMMNQGMQGNMNMMGINPQQMQQGGMMYGNQMAGGMQGGMNQGMGMPGGMNPMTQGMNMGMQGGMNTMNQGMNMGMQGGMGGQQQWR